MRIDVEIEKGAVTVRLNEGETLDDATAKAAVIRELIDEIVLVISLASRPWPQTQQSRPKGTALRKSL